MRHIRIASRAGKLALAQTNFVIAQLVNLSDKIEISVVTVTTKGDRDRSDFLYKADAVGFFTSEVEKALLDRRADLAVHSLKDMPTALTPGLVVAAIPPRESVADALVSSVEANSIADLPAGATVGTSSLRRIAQLRHIRKDLKCVPLRGNIETRIAKVACSEIDAAVVACAGLHRLSLTDKISAVLDPEQFFITPGQGALAVQVRSEDTELIKLVSRLDDEPTRITTEAERHILAHLHGGCSIPLGVYSKIDGDNIAISAMISDTEAVKYIQRSRTGKISHAKACAEQLTNDLLTAGAQEILQKIRRNCK